MKRILLSVSLSLSLVAPSYAGIPVVDMTQIKQNALNSMKELAEMAKQLVEAKNQLEQLKAQVNALTGVKGFSDLMKLGGVNEEIIGTFDDLLNGNTSNLTAKAQKYLENLPNCKDAKDPSMCESATLGGIAELDFVEKLSTQIDDKLTKVTELSERIKSAKDMKSMAELQANIALEANSIALIQQQTATFERLQSAQSKIAAQQAKEEYAKHRWEAALKPDKKPARPGSLSKLSDLMH